MILRVLGASGSKLPGFGLTSFLLDQAVLIDTGAAASRLKFEEQKKIETVFLSHLHIDHSLGLLLMADNLAGCSQKPVSIASLPEVLQGLHQHLFNNQVWPDFTVIPDRKRAVYRLCPLRENRAVRIGKYTVKAVKVSHSVPTAGFIISDGKSSLLYTADTRPTESLWQEAKKVKDLKAVLIETSFPNRLQSLADVSGHLTPKTLAGEIAKSGLKVPFYVFHIKALFAKEIRQEIAALNNSRIKLAREGVRYTF